VDNAGERVTEPESINVGVPIRLGAPPQGTVLAEVGADFCDLPSAGEVRATVGRSAAVTLIASHVITHRRSDPRYKGMADGPPEHAAVGHFERSRWTDEAWLRTDALATALDAQAVVLQTPASFKASTEHATRLENFLAHAMRPRVAIAWEWAKGSWPDRKAIDLCERIGAVAVVDPTTTPIPDGEFVYLRLGAAARRPLRDDDLKEVALAVRDRMGWVVFSNKQGTDDALRFQQMI
jgi:uncharacterized protein YecE (DUF72 family)